MWRDRGHGGEGGAAYREAEHDGVRVVVGEGAQAVEFLLTGRVPETQLDVCVVDEDVLR